MSMKPSPPPRSRRRLTRSEACLMLRRYIESRERYFHGRDTSRASLPFEWGLDWTGVKPNGHGNPLHSLKDFACRALQSSPSFFSCDPAAAYSLDGELLRFPSAVDTP